MSAILSIETAAAAAVESTAAAGSEVPWAWVLLACVGLGGSALCSGLETGFYRVSKVRLELGARAGTSAHRRMHEEAAQPERLLATLLLGNNIANYLGSLGLTGILGAAGLTDTAIIIFQAIVLTPVLLVFGEALPKELFRVRADGLTPIFAPAVTAMRWFGTILIVLPLIRAAVRLAERVTVNRARDGGAPPDAAAVADARTRMVELLRDEGAAGQLTEAQLSMVGRVSRFVRSTVDAEMTPWRQTKTLSLNAPRARLARAVAQQPYSRFPVVDASGRVVGVLRGLDLQLDPDSDIRALIRAPARLETGTDARDALSRIHAADTPLAVVERSGRPVGIVTPKDLVEPLIGELLAW